MRSAFANLLLVGGAGDTGRRLIRALPAHCRVVVTTRQEATAASLGLPSSVQLVQADPVRDPAGFRQVLRPHGPFDVVYNLLGAWLRNPRGVIVEGLQNLLPAVEQANNPPRLVFCSATTVYGHRPDEKLDENSRLQPDMEIGRLQAEAEAILEEACQMGKVTGVVLRLPHLYGPGRERTFDMMCQGQFLIVGDGTNPMHHLYIDDLVQALLKAGQADLDPFEVINVVDDIAYPYRAYCDLITDWYGLPRLPAYRYEEALRTGVVAGYLGEHQRQPAVLGELYRYMTSHAVIDNQRMKERLGVSLTCPTFLHGLTRMLLLRDGYTVTPLADDRSEAGTGPLYAD